MTTGIQNKTKWSENAVMCGRATLSGPVLKALLRSYSANEMELVAVSKLVNSPKNDVPECKAHQTYN